MGDHCLNEVDYCQSFSCGMRKLNKNYSCSFQMSYLTKTIAEKVGFFTLFNWKYLM